MSRDNRGSNLVFFLLGAATGAAIALLYAPQEGETTRRRIGEKATEYKDKASEVTSHASQSAKTKLQAATDKVQELIHRSKPPTGEPVEVPSDTAESA